MTSNIDLEYDKLMARAERHYQDPFMVEDFISPEQVKKMIDLYHKLPVLDAATHSRAIRKDSLMYSDKIKLTQDIFLDKIHGLFPDKKVIIDGGNFTCWNQAVGLHTDGYQQNYTTIKDLTHIYNPKEEILKANKVPAYTIVVPLETDTGEGQPYTLTFHQKYFGRNRNISDVQEGTREIIGYTDQPFDKTHPDYPLIDFHSDSDLHGYTIQNVFPWKPGRAIVFNRGQFHSAANFVGYNTKLHLLFFTSFQE